MYKLYKVLIACKSCTTVYYTGLFLSVVMYKRVYKEHTLVVQKVLKRHKAN